MGTSIALNGFIGGGIAVNGMITHTISAPILHNIIVLAGDGMPGMVSD